LSENFWVGVDGKTKLIGKSILLELVVQLTTFYSLCTTILDLFLITENIFDGYRNI